MKMVELVCDYCDESYTRRESSYRYDVRHGKKHFFCSIEHYYAFNKKSETEGVCEGCGDSFTRKLKGKDQGRFCSRKCSASWVSKTTSTARRKSGNECLSCGSACGSRLRCEGCYREDALASASLAELRSSYDTSQYHAKIRGHARSVFKKGGGLKRCKVCQYDLHVDIAHIKDVADFEPSATLSDVNSSANLVALCKNHHWEFDHGYLKL